MGVNVADEDGDLLTGMGVWVGDGNIKSDLSRFSEDISGFLSTSGTQESKKNTVLRKAKDRIVNMA